MNHLNRLILLFFFVFLCSTLSLAKNTTSSTTYNKDHPRPVMVQEPRRLPHFSNIDVSDDLHVLVKGGQSQQSVILVGDSRAVEEISTEVKNKTLYIRRAFPPKSSEEPYNHKVFVKIGVTGNLSGLSVSKKARLKAHHIRSHGLTMSQQDNGKLMVEGNDLALRKLENGSTENIVVSGIHTKHINVRGLGSGRIILSGHTGMLTAYLYDAACLEARHLRAEEVYIHTEENALGMVWPVKALYAFATDNSNIYYYHTPSGQLVRYTAEDGNVLKVP